MLLSRVLDRAVGFFRADYAAGVSRYGYVPLLALCRRRLSDDEASAIAHGLLFSGGGPVDPTDVSVAITKLVDDLPSLEDVDRVNERLVGSTRLDESDP